MGLIPRHGPKVLIDIRGSYIGTGLPLVGPVALVGEYIFPKDFPCALLQKNDRFPALSQNRMGGMVGSLRHFIDHEIPGLVSTGQEDPAFGITAQTAGRIYFPDKGGPDRFTCPVIISEETSNEGVISPGIFIIFIKIAGRYTDAFCLRAYSKESFAPRPAPAACTATVVIPL